MSRLHSPNLPRIIDGGLDDGQPVGAGKPVTPYEMGTFMDQGTEAAQRRTRIFLAA